MISSFSNRLARHLRARRQAQGWSLEDLADRSAVSRATLSRIENIETSPTAESLSKIARAFSIPVTQLLQSSEEPFEAHLRREAQQYSLDPATGRKQRSLSPYSAALSTDISEVELPAGVRLDINLEEEPVRGEHHLLLREGHLIVTVDGAEHRLEAGDSLRFQHAQVLILQTPHHSTAHYIVVNIAL